MTPPIKLAIGVPAYGAHVVMWHTRMWLTMGAALANSAERFALVSFDLVDACGIDVARNKLVHDALEKGADWLLMIDADTWAEDGGDILQMISDADKADQAESGWKPVGAVVAPVPRRDPWDTRPMVYARVPEGFRDQLVNIDLKPEGLQFVDSAATAMMAINLGFIRGVGWMAPWFSFEWHSSKTPWKPSLSEDHVFCRRVRESGGVILADPRVKAKHLQRPQVIE